MSDTIEVCDKTITWSYEDYGSNPYDAKTSDLIEQAYQKNPSGSTTVTASNGQTYTISFSDMKQTNNSSRYKRTVNRKEQKTNVRRVNVSELRSLFKKYAAMDETEEKGIGGEGIMQLAEDIGVDPMEVCMHSFDSYISDMDPWIFILLCVFACLFACLFDILLYGEIHSHIHVF